MNMPTQLKLNHPCLLPTADFIILILLHAGLNGGDSPANALIRMDRTIHARIDDHSSECGAFALGEFRTGFPIILSCSRLGAVDAVSPFNHVEVDFKNALFAEI